MTIQQQDAMWPIVQSIWATRNHRMITRRLAELLGISSHYQARAIVNAGLDRTQSREAFWARYNQMMRNRKVKP